MNSKTAATIAAIFIAAATGVAGDNLLPNGNFDLVDKGQPRHWDKDDKLTSFWISEPGRGTILKLDSRVDRNQALAWWDTLKKNPLATPPLPIIPQKPLQSVGANEGTFIDSDTIPVTPGQNYKLSVDYKGPVQPFVWIKGFTPSATSSSTPIRPGSCPTRATPTPGVASPSVSTPPRALPAPPSSKSASTPTGLPPSTISTTSA